MLIMLVHMMAVFGGTYFQFMFTKRMFLWKVDIYSYHQMLETVIQTNGMVILFPIFHYFNVNGNLIVMVSCLSGCSTQRLCKREMDVVCFNSWQFWKTYIFFANLIPNDSLCRSARDRKDFCHDSQRWVTRPANSGRSWEPSSKKEFKLLESFEENSHTFCEK